MSKSKAVAAMPEEEAGEGGFGNKVKIYLKEGNTEIMGNGEERPYSLWSKLVAEFIGDLIFIFIGSISVNLAQGALINIALAHGLAIFVLVSSLGHISGGHFNPAVTLTVALAGKLHALWVIPYWLAQLSGGFVGALLVRAVFTLDEYDKVMGGATIPNTAALWYQSLITEIILTMILCQTVLMCAVDTSKNVLAPLAIGMTVCLDILGGASISGASMNPARSLGPCAAATIFSTVNPTMIFWDYHYVYWAGPFLGATIAAFIYRTFFAQADDRLLP
ncbi:unnamed protein product [Bursaphelenchus xylophilus]|uniref:(pine wood nematode) hypothetical protein n=1 Tax=Bursaphelenchus xylophilus TaxID=6326 RepID=A0A7I8XMS1_BURXY|nr:unnamed protein product [Bursaphelenchus xylophilus]CAG9121797.1 unnamed protein product [Bursaphelenchus xylophilus]